VHRRFAVGAGRVAPSLWVCCALGVSAGLLSCGGLAADGPGSDAVEPGGSVPDESEPGEATGSVRPRRETCDDNPLLAECPRPADVCRDNPLASGCSSVSEPRVPDDDPVSIGAAQNVLLSNCGACHGPALAAGSASASINYIGDWDRLLRTGLIERCSPGRSRVIVLMRAGDMPPPNSGLSAVSAADIAVVVAAIEQGCD
jgi:hypothetical protein